MPKNASKTLVSLRLPVDVRAAFQARAEALGITESELGRRMIMEKLAAPATEPPAGSNSEPRALAAIIIAALSTTIELDEARQLIEEHLNTTTEGTP
jgi:antitoxin component of RelBE/YafQ-DinJ toxin-antitoxin module